MSSDVTLSESDEGKTVINQEGDTIGRVMEVEGGRAYIDPDPNVTDAVMSKLGWADSDEDAYPLEPDNIAEVTDDEIRLGSM